MWLKVAEIALLIMLAINLSLLLTTCAKKKKTEKEMKEILGEEGFRQYVLEIEREKKNKRKKNRPDDTRKR